MPCIAADTAIAPVRACPTAYVVAISARPVGAADRGADALHRAGDDAA